jgi:2'-5' RNA ligase
VSVPICRARTTYATVELVGELEHLVTQHETSEMVVSWSEAQAEKASFLAIVPPREIADVIQDLQRRIGVDTSVLPHVTVKAQPGLSLDGSWRHAVADALARRGRAHLSFTAVDWFGSGIVYLAVSDAATELHWTILHAVESVVRGDRFEYDGDAYVPHLTLGAEFAGATGHQLDALAADAIPFVGQEFLVDSVVEFHRSARDAVYVPVRRFALGD